MGKQHDVDNVPFWWHTIDLGDGVITPGQTSPDIQRLRAATIPLPLDGCTVLDVGCWDGYFSFWCEEQGASVTAVDSYQYRGFVNSKYGVALRGGEGFRVCHRWLESKVELVEGDFADLDSSWDVVLFMGIFYHQRHALLSLDHLRHLTSAAAVVETHYRPRDTGSTLTFYSGDSLNSDPTNYWGPSLDCMQDLLHEAGFKSVELIRTYWDNDDRAVFLARP